MVQIFDTHKNITHAKYPSITAEIELTRNTFYQFFKLIMSLLVSVLMASLCSTLSVYNNELYGTRISIIEGSLLASVLNQ